MTVRGTPDRFDTSVLAGIFASYFRVFRSRETGGIAVGKWLMRSTPIPRRRGFSLIELVIVMAIMITLAAFALLVVGSTIRGAREKATKATISKIDGLLRQRQEAFQRALEKAELQKAIAFTKIFARNAFPPEIDKFLVDQASERTWEVLARKTYFRANFPQSFAEVCWFDGAPGIAGTNDTDFGSNSVTDFYPSTFQYYPGIPDPQEFGAGATNDDLQPYARLLRERFTNPAVHNPETESAELLYLMLTAADLFGVAPAGQDEFSSTEVRDTDGDGLMEFVDAWERPLRFYRWPTRLLRCGEDPVTGDVDGDASTDVPGPESPAIATYANFLIGTLPSLTAQWEDQPGNDKPLLRDPDDGYGLINSQIIDRNSGGPAAARLKLEAFFHTPNTYHTTLIVSPGADGNLGLYEPVQFNIGANVYGHLAQLRVLGDPSASPLADNLTNRRQ